MTGRLTDAAWELAPWTADFVDISTSIVPRFRTRAKMLWSSEFLYIGAWMEEPDVWATLTEHNSIIFHDNDFEVFIDPDGDALGYYEFEVNALGTTWDLFLAKPYRDGGAADSTWESGARVVTFVDGVINAPENPCKGWGVEIAFPWGCFNEPKPEVGDNWRINFSRVEWQVTVESGTYQKIPNTPEDNWVWTPQGVIDMHQPEHWGTLIFSECPNHSTIESTE